MYSGMATLLSELVPGGPDPPIVSLRPSPDLTSMPHDLVVSQTDPHRGRALNGIGRGVDIKGARDAGRLVRACPACGGGRPLLRRPPPGRARRRARGERAP